MFSKFLNRNKSSVNEATARWVLKLLKPASTSSADEQYKEKGTPWLENFVNNSPNRLQPYLKLMRIDKPIGNWFVYFPCSWGIALATPLGQFPSLYTLGLMGAGAVVLRGLGCTINDLLDREFDKNVDRTKSRPIASGQVSVPQAVGFLALQSLAGLGVLLQFNTDTIALGLSSGLLVATYPLFKRFTYWPQAALGVTMNWGTLVGYSALINPACTSGLANWPACASLYGCGIMWTIIYDTIYSYQDIEDDKKLGLKSTAIYFGDNCKPWLLLFGVGMAASLGLVGLQSGAGPIFYFGAASALAHVAQQIYSLRFNDRAHCLHTFKVNRNTGLLIFASIALDRALATTALTTATGLM